MAATQNTRNVTPATLAPILKPAQLRKLVRMSKQTGRSLSSIIDRATDVWLEVEAPVYLAHAKEIQNQRI